jgi:FixJ family two-component response regulator
MVIAVVDDDTAVCESIVGLLASAGYPAIGYASAEAYLASARTPACLILDWHLPGISGCELRDRLRAGGASVPIVMISAHPHPDCLPKPCDGDELLRAVRRAMAT